MSSGKTISSALPLSNKGMASSKEIGLQKTFIARLLVEEVVELLVDVNKKLHITDGDSTQIKSLVGSPEQDLEAGSEAGNDLRICADKAGRPLVDLVRVEDEPEKLEEPDFKVEVKLGGDVDNIKLGENELLWMVRHLDEMNEDRDGLSRM